MHPLISWSTSLCFHFGPISYNDNLPGTVSWTPQPRMRSVFQQNICSWFWWSNTSVNHSDVLNSLWQLTQTWDVNWNMLPKLMTRPSSLVCQLRLKICIRRTSAHRFLLELEISSTRWELGRAFLIYAPGHPVQPSGWKNLQDCPGSERRLLMTEITAVVQTGQKWVHYPLSDGKFGPRQRKPRVQSHEFLEKVSVLGKWSIKSNSVACFQGQPFQNSF